MNVSLRSEGDGIGFCELAIGCFRAEGGDGGMDARKEISCGGGVRYSGVQLG